KFGGTLSLKSSAEEDYNARLEQELRSFGLCFNLPNENLIKMQVLKLLRTYFAWKPLADAPVGPTYRIPFTVEPLSVQNLTGAAGTSDVLPTAVATITALSTTFASAITVLSVSVDDYIITDEENVQPNV
ncbi:hypothetical protein Tco_1061348, partial [Tanacetum coccineum]